MKIISESQQFETKEHLPQILMRIFSVCKADPNFPLKDKVKVLEREVDSLKCTLEKKEKLLESSEQLHIDLKKRVDKIEQKNFDLKSYLLEKLGSE